MRVWRWVLGALAVGALGAACGGPSSIPAAANKFVAAEQPSAGAGPHPPPPTPSVMPRAPAPGPPLPPLTYEPKGRRDPFTPVQRVADKGGLEVGALRLVGVIQGRRLTALVEAPDGLGYILKPGDVLGNGRVTDITLSSVTFAVVGRADQRETSLTLRLSKD